MLSEVAFRVSKAACSAENDQFGACVVLNKPTGEHGSEPLPDVAFVQTLGICDLLTRRRIKSRHYIEMPGAVPNHCHQGQRAKIQHLHQPIAKSLGLLIIEF